MPEWVDFLFPSDYLQIRNKEFLIAQALKPNRYWSTAILWKNKSDLYWKLGSKPIFKNPGETGVMFFPKEEDNCFLFIKGKNREQGNSKLGIYRAKLPAEIEQFQCQYLE
jgi:hypothetical protein